MFQRRVGGCPGALASAFGPSVPPSAALWGPGTALEHRLAHPRIAGSGVAAGITRGVALPVLEDLRFHARGNGLTSLTSGI